MGKTLRVLLMVLGGLVGGYLGYWLGDLLGWSTDAEWPFHIGGGTGAILVSAAMAVIGAYLAGALAPIGRHERRPLSRVARR